jgi:hypothetical protein
LGRARKSCEVSAIRDIAPVFNASSDPSLIAIKVNIVIIDLIIDSIG